MDFNVTTGYGYILDAQGNYLGKYDGFSIGTHSGFLDGATIVEVPDKEALYSLPVCNPPMDGSTWDASTQTWTPPKLPRQRVTWPGNRPWQISHHRSRIVWLRSKRGEPRSERNDKIHFDGLFCPSFFYYNQSRARV